LGIVLTVAGPISSSTYMVSGSEDPWFLFRFELRLNVTRVKAFEDGLLLRDL